MKLVGTSVPTHLRPLVTPWHQGSGPSCVPARGPPVLRRPGFASTPAPWQSATSSYVYWGAGSHQRKGGRQPIHLRRAGRSRPLDSRCAPPGVASQPANAPRALPASAGARGSWPGAVEAGAGVGRRGEGCPPNPTQEGRGGLEKTPSSAWGTTLGLRPHGEERSDVGFIPLTSRMRQPIPSCGFKWLLCGDWAGLAQLAAERHPCTGTALSKGVAVELLELELPLAITSTISGEGTEPPPPPHPTPSLAMSSCCTKSLLLQARGLTEKTYICHRCRGWRKSSACRVDRT